MKYESRLKRLEQLAEDLPQREDFSALSDNQLNARIAAAIDAEYGSWQGFLRKAHAVWFVPPWPANGDLSKFTDAEVAAMIVKRIEESQAKRRGW